MKPKTRRGIIIVIFAMLFFLMAQASSSSGSTLEIVEPVANQTLNTSNVQITVRFNFTADSDRQTFRAWLNGKRVDALFKLTENDVASRLFSACDGVKASVDGPRWNVFRAEVNGQNGKKYQQTVHFLVDSSGNNTPVAQSTPGGRVFAGETVELDGSNSSDSDEDPIQYQWTLVTRPKGSHAKLSNSSSSNPSFIPDEPGTYEAQLVVSDCKAESEPQTVTVSAQQLTILVDGKIQDPIFDALSRYAAVTKYDGSQQPGDYSLVVLDGGNLTPEDLQNSPLVMQALNDGTWVLAFHLTDEQITTGLIAHLNIVSVSSGASNEASTAYLFKRFIGSDGVPVTQTIELPPFSQPGTTDTQNTTDTTESGLSAKEYREEYRAQAGTIFENLRTTPPLTNEPPIPDGLVVFRSYNTVSAGWTQNWSYRQPSTKGRVQTGSHLINYTFTLYLENGTSPPKQVLLLQVDGQANPNVSGSTFISTENDMDNGLEVAWFQAQFSVEVTPQNNFWIWVANDPSSPNKVTSYTTNTGFSITFLSAAIVPAATWNYTNSTSYSIPDWGVSCNSSGNHMYWDWRSMNPDYHIPGEGGGWTPNSFYSWITFWGWTYRPNDIAMNQAQYHAAVVWRTDQLVNQIAAFKVNGRQATGNYACTSNWGIGCGDNKAYEQDYLYERTYTIDLGVVIPVPIAAITFSQDPAPVGPSAGRIKGSVVLAEPVRMDTTIVGIKSNDIHATPVSDRVVVKKGNRAASFDIMVNAGQMQTGSSVFPTISAFLAGQYNQQFGIKAVDNLWFPVTSPSFDPNLQNWGGHPQPGGNWTQEYMVRYAVSFVDNQGKESERGPWTDWLSATHQYSPYAMPNLINIPTDPSNKAVKRKIYRQFFANYQASNPTAGVSLITTLNDNTTATYLDKNP